MSTQQRVKKTPNWLLQDQSCGRSGDFVMSSLLFLSSWQVKREKKGSISWHLTTCARQKRSELCCNMGSHIVYSCLECFGSLEQHVLFCVPILMLWFNHLLFSIQFCFVFLGSPSNLTMLATYRKKPLSAIYVSISLLCTHIFIY